MYVCIFIEQAAAVWTPAYISPGSGALEELKGPKMPNLVDLLLLLVVAASAWGGWYRGFFSGAVDLLRWVLSFLAALLVYHPVSSFIAGATGWPEMWTRPLAFIIVMVAAGVLVGLAGHAVLSRIPKETHESRANRFLGLLPGIASGLITAAILASILMSLPLSDGITESTTESRLANRLAGYTEEIETALVPIFDPAVRQTLNRMTTVEPGSNTSVELPFRVESARPRPELEAQMLELVNQERAAVGLGPLAPDPELLVVARAHSADMFARGYFSHQTPEGKSPFDRIREADVRFRTAGENLALAPTVEIAHRGLMNSPGHRENILRPQFGRVGIGILAGGRHGIMVTQKFRN